MLDRSLDARENVAGVTGGERTVGSTCRGVMGVGGGGVR